MSVYGDTFFNINIQILKLAGIWLVKYDKIWINILFFIYNVVVLTYTFIYFLTTEIYFMVNHTDDVRNLLKNISWNLIHVFVLYKLLLWFSKHRIILSVKETLQKPEFYYEDSNDFKPTEILEKFERLNYKFVATHFCFGSSIPITACLGAMFSLYSDEESMNGVDKNGNVTFCEKLPFASQIPFEINTNFRCGFASFTQSLGILLFGFMIISLDAMFTSTLCFVTAHINILLEAFKNLRSRALKKFEINAEINKETVNFDKYLNIEMNKCIHYLQTIIRLTENFETVYRFQALCQAMNTLFVFCLELYLVSSISVKNKSFLSELSCFICVGLEFSFYCWFANELSLASTKIPQALYESDWLVFPMQVKRSLLITMIRMKKPIIVTLGKFSPLTLETLVTILRASYSFFAVLKQANE